MALHVAGDLPAVELVVLNGMGAGAHQTHVAAQHVEQLGQLIEAPAAQQPAHGGDAGVVAAGLAQAGLVAGLHHPHGAELKNAEAAAIEAVAVLQEEDRAGAGEFHGQGDHQQQRADQRQAEAGQGDIKSAFELAIDQGALAAPEVDAGRVAHRGDAEAHPGLGPAGGIDHRQAGVAEEAEQLVHAQPVAGHVTEHDAVGVLVVEPAAHLGQAPAAGGQLGRLASGRLGHRAEPGHKAQPHPGGGEQLVLEGGGRLGRAPVEDGAHVAAAAAVAAQELAQAHVVEQQQHPSEQGPEGSVHPREESAGLGDVGQQQQAGHHGEPAAGDPAGQQQQAGLPKAGVEVAARQDQGGEQEHPQPAGQQHGVGRPRRLPHDQNKQAGGDHGIQQPLQAGEVVAVLPEYTTDRRGETSGGGRHQAGVGAEKEPELEP